MKSDWVSFETEEAWYQKLQKHLSTALVYIIDSYITIEDIPKWLQRGLIRSENVAKVIARDIKLHLNKLLIERHQKFFVGRNKEAAKKLIDKIASNGDEKPLFICADLADSSAIKLAIQKARDQLGTIHTLINNAANDQRHTTLEVTEKLWDELMNINLRHQFIIAQALIPQMIGNGGGAIINMSSNCFLLPRMASYPCYSIAKSAIVGLTRSLASEFGANNIRVNCVMPGWVMTKRQINKWLTAEAEKELMQDQALKKKLYPPDIARMTLFLAADDSQMISKQCFIVDGGRV